MIRNLKRKNIIILKDIIFSIIGCIFISAGIVFFLLPLKISAGGFSGIATITYYLFNLKLGTVIWILNIPLLIIGFFRIGKYFFFKTMFATWLLSFCINFFENMNLFLNIDDILLSAIYGGVIIGIGTTCIFKANNSTGGTELLIQIILSYKDNIKVSKLLISIDSIIVGLNLIIFKQIEIGLYSFIVIFLNSKIVDLFIEGVNFTKIVYIISDKSTEISNKILNDLDKGLSGIYGKGLDRNKEKLILMCVIKKRDLIKLKEIVKQVDDAAFMIISDAIDVYGLGFTKESKI